MAHTYIGIPCPYGHDGTRYARSNACVQCSRTRYRNRDRDNAAKRAYRKANPRDRTQEYAARKAARVPRTPTHKALLALIRNLELEVSRLRRAVASQVRAQPGYKAAQRRRARARDRERDPEGFVMRERAKRSKRRAIIRGTNLAGDVNLAALKALWEAQGGCAYCGDTQDRHLDHRHPLSLGGAHSMINLQWLCRWHNEDKGATTDTAYRRLWQIPDVTPWDAQSPA